MYGRSSYYDLGVSNYILYPMEKTNFCIVTILVFLTCLCNSDYHTYDNYQYDEYNYNENYDYNNQKPEDYTDDYSQELNDYYDQNLPNPPTPAPIPPPPPPPMGKITFFLGILNMMKYRLFIVTLEYRVSYAKYLIKSFLKCLLF